MKKFFTLIAVALMPVVASAQTIAFTEAATAGSLNGKTVVSGDMKLTITDTGNKVSVDANSCLFGTAASDTVRFAYRLKSGGKSSSSNQMSLVIPSDGTLKIYARTGSNSAADRNFVVTSSAGTEVINHTCIERDDSIDGGIGSKKCYKPVTATVTAGTYTITYPVSSINFYGFDLVVPKKYTIDEICAKNYKSEYSYGVSTYESGAMYSGYKGTGITMTKFDTDSVKITNLGGGTGTAKGKFDYGTQTITLAGNFYQFDEETVPTTVDTSKPAVAIIHEDGTININYVIDYGTSGNYGYKEILSESTQTLLWTVEGNLDYLNSDGSTKWGTHSYKGTLKHYSGDDYDYEVTYGDPSYGYANPATIQFKVNATGDFTLVNASSKDNYGYYYYYYPTRDIYHISFYPATTTYSGFDKGPSETEGEFYIWYGAYDSNISKLNEGYMNFSWPYVAPSAIDAIKDNADAKANKVVKTAKYIIKDGKKYNYTGQQMK